MAVDAVFDMHRFVVRAVLVDEISRDFGLQSVVFFRYVHNVGAERKSATDYLLTGDIQIRHHVILASRPIRYHRYDCNLFSRCHSYSFRGAVLAAPLIVNYSEAPTVMTAMPSRNSAQMLMPQMAKSSPTAWL